MADKNYSASDIKVLSDREHVRLRTAIYLGSTEATTYEVPIFGKDDIIIKQKEFIPALFKAFNEISDNAIDELTQLKKTEEFSWLNNYSNNITKQSVKDACLAYQRLIYSF